MTRLKLLVFAALLWMLITTTPAAFANDYGAVRGVVHDPQHRPIQNAMVMLKAKSSDWAKSVTTDATGQFQFNAVALGEYSVSVASKGFAQTSQDVIVISGSVPVVHFQLQVASANEKVTVSALPAVAATDSFTPTTLVSRLDIERTPGADGTNSMAMITDYVPAAYVTHDMLHMRGGHQITWLLARDHGDWVGAIGVNGALGGATWNVEVLPTVINGGPTLTSVLGNVSDAVRLAGRNATVFLEYFHNGFGAGSGHLTLATLPLALTERLARGQLFDTRRDDLAAGLTLEVNPLLNVSPTVIVDLDDGSLFALIAATYSLSNNLSLIGGVQVPEGRVGTEFGGILLAPGSQTLLAPATQIYLQIRKYF